MSDKKLNLSRRRLLAGLGVAGVGAAGAGLGTTAFLSDTESFDGNVLTAGTLDLLVGYYSYWDQGRAGAGSVQGTQDGSGTVSGELTDVKPGDSGMLTFCPQIETNPAYLWLCGELTANDENGRTEPETDVDDTTGADNGELAQSIEVTVAYCDLDDDVGDDGGFRGADDVASSTPVWNGSFAEFMTALESGVPLNGADQAEGEGFLAPGEQSCFAGTADEAENRCLCIDWKVPVEVGNEIQSDSLAFDLEFHAEQCRHNDGTHNPCAEEGPDCVACELPAEPSLSSAVQVSSVDASAFPSISAFLRVDTTAGNNGELTADDFEVCENGLAQDEAVSFTSGSAADIVFVFDDTGSMGDEITGATDAIGNFVSNITGSGIDARFALVSFEDVVQLDQDFTSDQSEIDEAIGDLFASGGGDFREDNFDAIGVATRDKSADNPSGAMLSSFRPGAQKVIIDITDAAAQVDNSVSDYTMADVEAILSDFTYIAVSPTDLDSEYSDGDKQILANNVGGEHFELPESNSDEFSDLLTDEVSGLLTTTYSVTYTSCDADGDPAERDILIAVDDPEMGTLYQTASYTVPP